jgi:hypothetical protein
LADGYDYAGQDPIDAYDLSGTAVDPVLQDAGWGGGPPGAYGNGVLAGDVDSGFIDEEGTGIARSRAVGRAGEDQVPGVKNTTRIQSYTGSAKYRVPDRFNATAQTIGEVKNVARLSFTSQLKGLRALGRATRIPIHALGSTVDRTLSVAAAGDCAVRNPDRVHREVNRYGE